MPTAKRRSPAEDIVMEDLDANYHPKSSEDGNLKRKLKPTETAQSNVRAITEDVSPFSQERESAGRYASSLETITSWPTVKELVKEAGNKDCRSSLTDTDHSTGPLFYSQIDAKKAYSSQGSVPRGIRSNQGDMVGLLSQKKRGHTPANRTTFSHDAPSNLSDIMGLNHNEDSLVSPSTACMLLATFEEKIHVLHPFLDLREVRSWMHDFMERHQAKPYRSHVESFGNSIGLEGHGRCYNGGSLNTTGHHSEIDSSREDAVNFLILAIGQICAHQESKSVILKDCGLDAQNTRACDSSVDINTTCISTIAAGCRTTANSSTHTAETRVRSSEALQAIDPSSGRQTRLQYSLEPSTETVAASITPGLAYYHKATQAMPDKTHSMLHAQSCLLAGIYLSLISCPEKGMDFFRTAGKILLRLLYQEKLCNSNFWEADCNSPKQIEHNQRLSTNAYHQSVVLASWACLQLEREIRRALPLPSSGIEDVEYRILMPSSLIQSASFEIRTKLEERWGEHCYADMLMSYSAQLYLGIRLRKTLSQMHDPILERYTSRQLEVILRGHETTLIKWREGLPVGLRWEDQDLPTQDVLKALLCAKYWELCYMINRPFLDFALHIMPQLKNGFGVRQAALHVYGDFDELKLPLLETISQMDERKIWDACKSCIIAAFHGAIAFSCVPGRLPVVDLYGVSHT